MERLLAEAGLLGDVVLRDLPLHWVPLDEDLLSLEMGCAFKARPGWAAACGGHTPRAASAGKGLMRSPHTQHCSVPSRGKPMPLIYLS